MASGYALAAPSISMAMTDSAAFMYWGESLATKKTGLSIGGMPSLGGPPETISP